jgi:hypothetical protein
MSTTARTTADRIARYLRWLHESGDVIELRILKVVDDPKYKAFTISGYFDHDHFDELAKIAMQWTSKAEGVYVTINPVLPDLLARARNRVIKWAKHATRDVEIVRRTALVFDADPLRLAGVSATDEEKALAWERINRLKDYLTRRGWPAPIVADSGNGYHLLYKIDLPNDDKARDLVERVQKGVAARYTDDTVKFDPLFDANRIIKLYGTMSRKGDSIDARPHRWSGVISAPKAYQVVPTELLEALAAEYQPVSPPPRGNGPPRKASAKATARGGASPEDRARAYVFAPGFPDSIAGQHGHDRLYHVACVLVEGFGLSHDQALPIFQDWNQDKAQPPESDEQIQHKLDDAIKNHPRPSLNLLNADRDAVMHREDDRSPGVHPLRDSATHGSGSGTHGSGSGTHGRVVYQNHVYQEPQPCVSGRGLAQPCVPSPAPQPCVPDLPEDVQGIVLKHGCNIDPARWWEALFKVRRELNPIAKDRAWDLEVWKAVAAYWIAVCRGNGLDVPGFETVWAQLKKKLRTSIKEPFGEVLARVRARIPDVDVPPELAVHARLEPLARVMIALAEENALCGRTEFYASCRDIADLAGGMSPTTAHRRLGALSAKGYLSMPTAGTPGTRRGGKANTWIWYDPPRPGATVWNSSTARKNKECAGQPVAAGADGIDPAPVSLDGLTVPGPEDRPAITAQGSLQGTLPLDLNDGMVWVPPRAPGAYNAGDAGHWLPNVEHAHHEHAGILEHDAGLTREAAEIAAGLRPLRYEHVDCRSSDPHPF